MAWYEKPTLIRRIAEDKYYVFGDESGDIRGLKATIKKYAAGDSIKERDATFSLTSVFLFPKCLESLYASFQNIKQKYLGKIVPFHANEISSKTGLYSIDNMDMATYQNFIIELDEEVNKCKYTVQVTAFNKWDYVSKRGIKDPEKASEIISQIYKEHFKRVEKMLEDYDKKATFVLEESSNPKLDKLILIEFIKLRKRQTIKRIESLYFTRKDATLYPAGTELADIVSQSMFYIFSHPKCYISLKKTYFRSDLKKLDIFLVK